MKFPLSNIIDLEFGDVETSNYTAGSSGRSRLPDSSTSPTCPADIGSDLRALPSALRLEVRRPSIVRATAEGHLRLIVTGYTSGGNRPRRANPIVIGPSPIFRSIGRDQQSASKVPVRRPGGDRWPPIRSLPLLAVFASSTMIFRAAVDFCQSPIRGGSGGTPEKRRWIKR